MMDVQAAKTNMIKQQIRSNDVLDDNLLHLFKDTPRDFYTPAEYRAFAFTDTMIPIGHRQVMMTPTVEALILDHINLKPTDKVLEIGTGTGYFTALLAKLAQHVYSVDIFPEFTEQAQDKLKRQGIENTSLITGNAANGWPKQQPYDAIVITGGLPSLPEDFLKELKIGGRLFAILGNHPVMEATLITRVSEDQWQQDALFETEIPYLLHTTIKPPFVF